MATTTTKTYDPSKVSVTFGNHIIAGYAEDSAIKVERSEDTFKVTVGLDGEGARTRTRNQSGKITVTLLASSASNDALQAFVTEDENTGEGVRSISVRDANGTSLASGDQAWVAKTPNREWGKELGKCEWVFEVVKLNLVAGGIK